MIRIELKDDEITAALASLSRALVNKAPVMERIGNYMVVSTQDRMERGMTPEGGPFAARAQSTLDAYARQNISYGLPLNRRGFMRAGISAEPTESEVTIGSGVIQAAVMQFGNAQGNIPARPFLGVSDDDRTNIIATIEEWLDLATKGGA